MEPREHRSLRLSKKGIAAVQAIADRDDCSWSEAVRRMLAYASHQMPKGYGAPADFSSQGGAR